MELVVLFHGFQGSPRVMAPIAALVKKIYPSAKVLIPKIPIQLFSTIDLNRVTNDILRQIDEAWVAIGDPTTNIILLGHSLGGIFARKVYIISQGEQKDVPFEAVYTFKAPRAWAPNVKKVILLAGMNNGWQFDFHATPLISATISLLKPIGNFLTQLGMQLSVYQVKRGGTFITQLKLQTIALYEAQKSAGADRAITVQLLGTKDNLVSPEDNLDLISMGNFFYLEAVNSTHNNIIDITNNEDRTAAITKALVSTKEDLEYSKDYTTELPAIVQDKTVSDVVFVIHGIRDNGYWTKKVANRVVSLGNDKKTGRKFQTETSSYGYFPMLYFTLPSTRRDKVHWLMDQYAENKLKYPAARFSFIGHSNGTYLLAKALEQYPACRFHNVLLAGSVVNGSYNWNKLKAAGRISRIYNIAATSDWVVGIFPNALGTIGYRELGAGGYWGFKDLQDAEQIITIPGGHGAGIEEERWNDIAKFIVDDNYTPKFAMDERKRKVPLRPAIAVLIVACILFLIGYGAYGIIHGIADGAVRMLVLIVYVLVLWKILTKF